MLTCVYMQLSKLCLYGAAYHHCIAGHACKDSIQIHCVKYLHKQREEISVLTFKVTECIILFCISIWDNLDWKKMYIY